MKFQKNPLPNQCTEEIRGARCTKPAGHDTNPDGTPSLDQIHVPEETDWLTDEPLSSTLPGIL
jgi:hypothetical protein